MPTYTYECGKCGETQDVFHGMSESPKVACGTCGSKRTTRLMGRGAGIIFKGSGFYETDFKHKGTGPAKNGNGESKKSETAAACNTGSCGCAASDSTPKQAANN